MNPPRFCRVGLRAQKYVEPGGFRARELFAEVEGSRAKKLIGIIYVTIRRGLLKNFFIKKDFR